MSCERGKKQKISSRREGFADSMDSTTDGWMEGTVHHMGGPGPDNASSCGGLELEGWVWFRGCLDGCAGMGRHQVERLSGE